MTFLVVLLLGYLVLVGGLALFQRRLIYYPMKATSEQLSHAASHLGFEPWQVDTGRHIGWRRKSTHPPAAGQVLIVHGNAGHALHRAVYADALQRAANLDIWILEYPGYGDRPGKPTERSLCEAADEALSSLPPDRPVYVLGESLGTGVAAYLAGRHPERIAGLLLIAPYDRLANVAQAHFRLFPVNWFLRDRFDSGEHLRSFTGKVGIWVGSKDVVVPARFGRRLHETYAGPKRLWEAQDAGHEDVFREPPEWWRSVTEFWGVPAAPEG